MQPAAQRHGTHLWRKSGWLEMMTLGKLRNPECTQYTLAKHPCARLEHIHVTPAHGNPKPPANCAMCLLAAGSWSKGSFDAWRLRSPDPELAPAKPLGRPARSKGSAPWPGTASWFCGRLAALFGRTATLQSL